MRLASLKLFGMGVLDGTTVALGDDEVSARPLTVLFGADGVGKTTILGAIASTRPGYALPLATRLRPRQQEDAPAYAVGEWLLGDDDPERPHALVVASPNMPVAEGDQAALLRRREQALFDKKAQHGGHVLVAVSGARWFSRTPVLLTTPERTILRYDVRAPASFDDASRADMARETKQVLSYAGIARALEPDGAVSALDRAAREVCEVLLPPYGVRYLGPSATSLEPVFERDGRPAAFDDLPRGARHLLAVGASVLRALYGAFERGDVRFREGVALVDDLELQQDAGVLRLLPGLLREALPRVQWVIATSSPAVTLGCTGGEVLALRRDAGRVELQERAIIH